MYFDYSVYYRQDCLIPLLLMLFLFLWFGAGIISFIKGRRTTGVTNYTKLIVLLAIFFGLFSINAIHISRGGYYLLFEKETDQIQIDGIIENMLETDFYTGAKYDVENNKGSGEAIIVNGEKYYLMTYGNFKSGDHVLLSVLPQSHFVLKIEYYS